MILARVPDGYHPKIRHSLFAIDFVPFNGLYAVDFNVAPGIRGTGGEEVLPAKEIAGAIKQAVVRPGRPGCAVHCRQAGGLSGRPKPVTGNEGVL